MKILVVHNAYQSHQVGGEDVAVKAEITGLKKRLGENNVFEYLVCNDDIQSTQVMLNLWGDKNHYRQVYQLVKKHKIDIVHVHNFFPLLTPMVFIGAKAAKAKVIHTLHNFRWWCRSGIFHRQNKGICEQCLEKQFSWPAIIHGCYRGSRIQSLAASMAFYWYHIKKYSSNIDAYFVLSQFQKQKLQHLLSSKVFLKPNAIKEPMSLLPIENKKDFLFVGRLEEAKGIHLLLSAWEQLPSPFCLKIIGKGENDSILRKRFDKPNIQFLGSLPHESVLSYMNQAKFFIHSSLTYETFGLTALEALSYGTPVIAINRGPRAEYIQSGFNGFLGEPQQLKEMIIEANEFPNYNLLSKKAFESAKPFYLDNVMSMQEGFYNQILQKDWVS